MDNLIIRQAVIEDLPTLLQFEQELINAERPFDVTIRGGKISYYDIEEYISKEDVQVLVAEHNGNVVSSGYALIKAARHYLDHAQYSYLGFMYTIPSYRGKGINKLIIAELIQWSKNRGLKEVRLTVYDQNIPAIKAYKKAGFTAHIAEMRLDTGKTTAQKEHNS